MEHLMAHARLTDRRQINTYEVDCPHEDGDILRVTLERSQDVDSEIHVTVTLVVKGEAAARREHFEKDNERWRRHDR